MANRRTFGWIQNPGDLKKLKKVVSIFLFDSSNNKWLRRERLPLLKEYGLISDTDYNSFINQLNKKDIVIGYNTLKGRGAGSEGRANAKCTGIIQAVIDGQKNRNYVDSVGNTITIKKPYVDDWSAEGYLRWSISCGLVDYDESSDTCQISDLGIRLAQSLDGSAEEQEVLSMALLSYPPVIRILSLLYEKDKQTKFELGKQLGFKGEMGFSSIPQEIYLCDYCEATTSKEKSDVRSNVEGDSDKYARSIASWCQQMGWIETSKKNVSGQYRGKNYTATLQAYSITRAGEKALIKARGNSSNPRLPRIVTFQMLASNKAHGADYLRYLRGSILKALSPSPKTLVQLKESLKGYDLEVDTSAISDSIVGLINIGIEINKNGDKYKLLDNITMLNLPPRNSCVKDEVNEIVDRVRSKLAHLDHKYLVLIDLAYSDAATRASKNADAREFEIQTAELFTEELAFKGVRLGDSNKPDVIVSYGNTGTIIDNKSYKDGFNINASSRDEMQRYINENIQRSTQLNSNEWWNNFEPNLSVFTFLFVTSYLKGSFKKQLDYISTATGGIKGAAIGIESLLYLSEGIKSGQYAHSDFYSRFNNEELIFTL